jgi:ribosomal protein S18 acetylase RimI-like enzyme
MPTVDVRRLGPDDVALVGEIDRSEHVELQYTVVDGRLVEQPPTVVDVPAWFREGTGDFTVAAHIEFCTSAVQGGGVLFGAFAGTEVAGLAIVDPSFEADRAWLAFLHVSRRHRRQGVAQALWDAAAELARRGGATSIYVSATPTGSAIGFYLRQGCELADPVHAELFAHEPEDIHLTCPL